MMMSVVTIFNLLVISYAAETFNCTNGNVYLNLNEIAFFETPDFPSYLSQENQKQCDLQFLLTKYKNTSYQMVLAFYQFPKTFKQFPTVFLLYNDSSYLIQSDFPDNGDAIAEQGFIAFVDRVTDCPLEFLSKDKPFKILKENQILYIRSSYFNNQIRQKPCQWKFRAPDGFGLKIVIQSFNVSSTTFLRIENTTDIIINYNTSNTWKNIRWYSSVYTIIIPTAAAIFIRLEKNPVSKIEKIAEPSYKSFITSPDYGCIKSGFDSNEGIFGNFTIINYPVIFTVLDYYLTPSDELYFMVNKEKIMINKTGDYMVFRNQSISIYYTTNRYTPQSGILLLIQTYKEKVLNDKIQ